MDLKTFIKICSKNDFYDKDIRNDFIFAINKFYDENPKLYYCTYQTEQRKSIKNKLQFFYIINLLCDNVLTRIIETKIQKRNGNIFKYKEYIHVNNLIKTNNTIIISPIINDYINEIESMFNKTNLTWEDLTNILENDYLYLTKIICSNGGYNFKENTFLNNDGFSIDLKQCLYKSFQNKYHFFIRKYVAKNFALGSSYPQSILRDKDINHLNCNAIRSFQSFLDVYFSDIIELYCFSKIVENNKDTTLNNNDYLGGLKWPNNLQNRNPDVIEKYIGLDIFELYCSEINLHYVTDPETYDYICID